jgi:hypothetical protein
MTSFSRTLGTIGCALGLTIPASLAAQARGAARASAAPFTVTTATRVMLASFVHHPDRPTRRQ